MKKNIKKVAVLIAFVGTNYMAMAQTEGVSIKSTVSPPDESAMLDIENSSKGLLIPRVSLISTDNPSPVVNPAVSMIVYNTATTYTFQTDVVPGFYYWDGLQWIKLIVEEKDRSGGNIVNVGGIIMWSGMENALPYGWQLCNNSLITNPLSPLLNQVTPDLSGKFIVGYNAADPSYDDIGKTGGEAKNTLITDNLPSHNHAAEKKIDGQIGLNGNTLDCTGHTHTLDTYDERVECNDGGGDKTPQSRDYGDKITSYPTGAGGVHSHKLDGSYTITGTLNVAVFPEGKNAPLENRPPYYVLAFIMRIQ
jgi:microcystin-dependent protein